jgi:hypothetical protein
MTRLTNVDSRAYIVSDISNLYDGRTITMRKQSVIPESGIFSLTEMSPPDPGIACGLDSINVSVDGGVAEITWTFRTQHDEGDGGGGAGDLKQPEYELTCSTSQEPITSHPKYEQLYNKYALGEENGEPVWMTNDPDQQSGSSGLSTSGGNVLSPLYGVRDYLAANGVYKETKYYRGRGSVPNDLISKCGKIEDPPSLSNSGVQGRWLRCGAQIRQMGDSYQVTIMWMASQSEKNLWKKEIYG